jgi:hypothetical protein
MADTTVVVTSCGRQDLLERTIASFLRFNSASIERFIVVEDGSGEPNLTLQTRYSGDSFLWLATGTRVGQIRAIDAAYQYVRTPYIFHCEDDWEFYAGGFIELSQRVLEEHSRWLQVQIRAVDDLHGHPLVDQEYSSGPARYRVLQHDWDAGYFGTWHGFAFNPGLRRLADYERLGSYAQVVTFDPDRPWEAERQIGVEYKARGFYTTVLTNNDGKGYVRHIGENRHVDSPSLLSGMSG